MTALADLVAQADRRPTLEVGTIVDVRINGDTRRALHAPPPSRITWTLRLAAHAELRTALALRPEAWTQNGDGVLFRIGISDGRTYEELLNRQVNPFRSPDDRRWIPVRVDLARYGGFQFSLFYRPDRRPWQLILSTNSGPPGSSDSRADRAIWGAPVIYAPATWPLPAA